MKIYQSALKLKIRFVDQLSSYRVFQLTRRFGSTVKKNQKNIVSSLSSQLIFIMDIIDLMKYLGIFATTAIAYGLFVAERKPRKSKVHYTKPGNNLDHSCQMLT